MQCSGSSGSSSTHSASAGEAALLMLVLCRSLKTALLHALLICHFIKKERLIPMTSAAQVW
jgi:hypothetical protein